MKPASSSDLESPRMPDEMKEIWKNIQPLRADSAFQALVSVPTEDFQPISSAGSELKALAYEVSKLYGLDATSIADKTPYHAATAALAWSLHIDCKLSSLLEFPNFVSNMHLHYKRLLEQKVLGRFCCWRFGT